MSDTALSFSPILERLFLYIELAIATLVAFTNWRREDSRAFRDPLIAFFALWFVGGALLAAAASPALLPPALVQGLQLAAIVLLAWGFLAPSLPARVSGFLLIAGLTVAAALSAFAIGVARAAGSQPVWMASAWNVAELIVAAGTALALTLRRTPDRSSATIGGFAGLALSAGLDLLLLPDLAGVCRIIAFGLFPIGLYQRAIGDLRSSHDTLREFSQSALKQTQELVTLLEASTYLFTSFDLDELLRRVAEHAAIGIDADRAAIFLTDPASPQSLRVGGSYPAGSLEIGQTFLLGAQPAIALAMSSGEVVSVGPRGQGAAQLMRLLNFERLGSLIVQPLSTQDDTIGVFVAANSQRGRPFSEGQLRLLDALSAQMAAAIANARLYRGLDTQARELARVLATREQEVGWYASILESMGDGVIVADRSDTIVISNSAVPRLLDTPLEYVMRRPLGTLFERMVPVAGAPSLATGAQETGVVRAAFEFGDLMLHVSLAPVRALSGDRLGSVILLRDITAERRRADSRAAFIGQIAQEFRSPLDTIRGYGDLLAKGSAGSLPPAALGFVETIRAHASRLSAQVDAVLRFNELDQGRVELHLEETNVASLVAELVEERRPQFAARRIALDVNVRPNLPSVRADRARARQVIDQLLDNAFQFTPDGGEVRLSAAPSWDGRSADRPAFVSVAIADNGVGFGLEEGQRIFEALYRGEARPAVDRGGLGIGLTIARSMCEAMGGQLWASGRPGRGATFTLILPVQRLPEPPAAEAPAEAATFDDLIERALSSFDNPT